MIHVIMPFSRPEMVAFYLYEFMELSRNVVWNPVVQFDFPIGPVESRIPIFDKVPEGNDICYWKINKFHDYEIADSDYYTFLCDDDHWEPGYFHRIAEHPQTPVIITSMKRGDNAIGHGTSNLMAHPDNMRVGEIGLEQIVLRGDVFREYRFNSMNSCADGEMAERLKASGLPITYCRDAFVRFNWFQPGRWDK